MQKTAKAMIEARASRLGTGSAIKIIPEIKDWVSFTLLNINFT